MLLESLNKCNVVLNMLNNANDLTPINILTLYVLLNTNTSLNDVTYLYKNKYIESNNMSLELNYTNNNIYDARRVSQYCSKYPLKIFSTSARS